MAGYSKRSLADKLGIKAGHRLLFIGAPAGYVQALSPMPAGAQVITGAQERLDFIHLFAADEAQLRLALPRLRNALVQNGMLWVSWPKKSSGVSTDLTENRVRELGLENRLVDVKVAAVDETWSGLKFVIRLKDRVPDADA